MLSKLLCYHSLFPSEAGPQENKPCSLQSHVTFFFPVKASSEMRRALLLMSASKNIRGHMKQHSVSFNSLQCYGRARGLFNLI